jgi:hypothetical protein
VRAIFPLVQADSRDPFVDQARILPRAQVAEVIWRQRSWPSASVAEMATLRWVDLFNHHRLFGPIPPAEAEGNYYAANEILDVVA